MPTRIGVILGGLIFVNGGIRVCAIDLNWSLVRMSRYEIGVPVGLRIGRSGAGGTGQSTQQIVMTKDIARPPCCEVICASPDAALVVQQVPQRATADPDSNLNAEHIVAQARHA